MKKTPKIHGDNRYIGQFGFIRIYRFAIENSKDCEMVMGSLPDIKIYVLNNSLYMEVICWSDAGNPAGGLGWYLKNIALVCLHGVLSD